MPHLIRYYLLSPTLSTFKKEGSTTHTDVTDLGLHHIFKVTQCFVDYSKHQLFCPLESTNPYNSVIGIYFNSEEFITNSYLLCLDSIFATKLA